MEENTTHFELVTPEALAASEAVGMVVIPGAEGDMGVMRQHAPLIAQLRPGVIRFYDTIAANPRRHVFVSGGVAEIDGEHCVVLAEEAIDLSQADAQAAQNRLNEAKVAMESASTTGEKTVAQNQLVVAEALVTALSLS